MAEMLSIKHHIPGRVRLRIDPARRNRDLGQRAAAWLLETGTAEHAEFRPVTGSIIVIYHAKHDRAEEIADLLFRWLEKMTGSGGETSATPSKAINAGSCECAACSMGGKGSFLGRIAGLLLLTGYVIYVFVRKTILKLPVSESTFSLTSLVAGIGAWPLLKQAWNDLRQGRHVGLFPFLAATFFLAIAMGEALTALEVIWILRLGMLLEEYVSERSRRAIRDILKLTERNAYLYVDGIEVEVVPDSLKEGDVVVCHTGEKIPVDGTVIDGEALVDESAITGRAEHVERKKGRKVFAGTLVSQGVIYIKAEKVGDNTYLARIVRMVEGALASRAPAEKMADVLAGRLTLVGAAAVAGTLLFTFSPYRAFTVLLVIACPCATVLAASTAVSAALASAAENSILIKGGLYLEEVGRIGCFCFDKTGTLTSETPAVAKVITRTSRQRPESVIALAAAAEAHNQHPVAKAILAAAKQMNIDIKPHAVCEFIVGRGVKATVNGNTIMVGNETMMDEHGTDTSWFRKRVRAEIEKGNTVVFVARDRKVQGVIVISNMIRPEARTIIDRLREDSVREFHLISGDAGPVVEGLAEELGFDFWKGDLLPEQKAEYVRALERRGIRTAMVGDGINDAIALANASIGIAMGAGGAEAAIEASDIALARSDLNGLLYVRQLSHKTISIIEQNHMLAVGTNVGGVILGAAGLLTPVMAGALHIVHTLGILLNSGRLLRWKPAIQVGTDAGFKKERSIADKRRD